MSTSKHLSAWQMKGLGKVGDVVVPGDDVLPSFTESGSIEHVDRMLDHMTDFDRDGVKALLTLLRCLPGPLIAAILWVVQQDRRLPGPLGAACRMVNIGIKGVVLSLYYSDLGPSPCILPAIGYDAKVGTPRDARAGGEGDRS
mgnify:FL=1